MKSHKFLFLAAAGIVIAGAAAAYFLFFPKGADFVSLRKGRDLNVIIITLDTARADGLACYGCQDVQTPTIDRFAARGVRFERCYAQTPLTLPSHTTLMTGTLPLFHGVRDNGGFLVPQKLVTLAELFKDKGYETGAFIAAYVLDSKWGLNQGFDTYFDKFDLNKFQRVSLETVQRPANEVMDEALPWLEKKKDKKFFTWIHLYDPHSPYEPPPPFDKQYATHPYLGEIAFADSQLHRLWQFLETNNLLENSLIVFAGDHGESLGEHEEKTHGFFVYQSDIHVPLIIVTPFPKLQGIVSPEVGGLVDVLPTVCEMAGLPIPGEVQGKSLVPAFYGRRRTGPSLVYSETYYPRFHFGWSDLKSVQNARYKLILAPVPELYDIAADPHEEKNLVYLQKKVYEDLNAEAEAFIQKSSRNAYEMDTSRVDQETREKLSALGYVGSFTDPAKLKGKTLANPKEKIAVFNELSRAREIGMNGKPDEAIKIIQGIIATDPDITDAYFSIGSIYIQEQKYGEAIDYFKQVLDRKPDETFAALNITRSYERMGKLEEAEHFALDYLQKGFEEPQLYFMLGNMNFLQKKYDLAIPYYEKCLSLNTESAGSCDTLAAIYIVKGDLARAEEYLRKALELNPRLPNVHYRIAWIAEKQGRLQEAEAEYVNELQISPQHFKALYNLARVYQTTGNIEKELETLKRCLEADPKFPLTYFYLARLYLVRGERTQEAIDFVKKGLDLKPDPSELPLGYFLLADLYKRVGDNVRSRECAEKGQALAAALKTGK
jgi:arylsulfatase A-like enzyme/predicted Zn-dependent protease